MRRGHKAEIVILAIVGVSTLTACGASHALSAGELTERVAATIEERVGIPAQVDCGDERISVVEANTVQCAVTDVGIDVTYSASVEIVNTDGRGGSELELSVDPAGQTKQHDEGIDS